MSHVTGVNETHVNASRLTCECVMSHTCMSHVTHTYACYVCLTRLVCASDILCVSEAHMSPVTNPHTQAHPRTHTHTRVTPVYSHSADTNESCHTYE